MGGRGALGKIADPAALDAAAGPRGALAITVPTAWLEEGAALEIAVPARVACGRCEGGGCDGCARSGAFRTPSDPAERIVRVKLPSGAIGGAALRVPKPFGDSSPLELLVVAVRPGSEHTAGVARRPAGSPPPALRFAASRGAAIATMVVVAALVIAAVLAGR